VTIYEVKPGMTVTWVTWLRGGYGYHQPVDGIVVRVTSKRVRIAVSTRDGRCVERLVKAGALRPRKEM
jgi:hypothetical protein